MRWGTVETMPFGKYAGWAIEDIPADYLRWCLRNLERMGPDLRRAMVEALGDWEDDDEPPPPPPRSSSWSAPRPAGSDVAGLVERAYRAAVMKYHPDRGGTTEAMQALNDMRDRLLQSVRDQFGT